MTAAHALTAALEVLTMARARVPRLEHAALEVRAGGTGRAVAAASLFAAALVEELLGVV